MHKTNILLKHIMAQIGTRKTVNLLVDANRKNNADTIMQKFLNEILQSQYVCLKAIRHEVDILEEMQMNTPNMLNEKKEYLDNFSLNDQHLFTCE